MPPDCVGLGGRLEAETDCFGFLGQATTLDEFADLLVYRRGVQGVAYAPQQARIGVVSCLSEDRGSRIGQLAHCLTLGLCRFAQGYRAAVEHTRLRPPQPVASSERIRKRRFSFRAS
jgi:hypothetical protein